LEKRRITAVCRGFVKKNNLTWLWITLDEPVKMNGFPIQAGCNHDVFNPVPSPARPQSIPL